MSTEPKAPPEKWEHMTPGFGDRRRARDDEGRSREVIGDLQARWGELAEAVIAAARKTSRGCDCEYDHRCGRCSAIVELHAKIKAFDAFDATLEPVEVTK